MRGGIQDEIRQAADQLTEETNDLEQIGTKFEISPKIAKAISDYSKQFRFISTHSNEGDYSVRLNRLAYFLAAARRLKIKIIINSLQLKEDRIRQVMERSSTYAADFNQLADEYSRSIADSRSIFERINISTISSKQFSLETEKMVEKTIFLLEKSGDYFLIKQAHKRTRHLQNLVDDLQKSPFSSVRKYSKDCRLQAKNLHHYIKQPLSASFEKEIARVDVFIDKIEKFLVRVRPRETLLLGAREKLSQQKSDLQPLHQQIILAKEKAASLQEGKGRKFCISKCQVLSNDCLMLANLLDHYARLDSIEEIKSTIDRADVFFEKINVELAYIGQVFELALQNETAVQNQGIVSRVEKTVEEISRINRIILQGFSGKIRNFVLSMFNIVLLAISFFIKFLMVGVIIVVFGLIIYAFVGYDSPTKSGIGGVIYDFFDTVDL